MTPGGHAVVALCGEIDIVTAPATRDLLAEAVSQAVTGITVDLSEVTFMDAAGLGVLAGANRDARHLPGGLHLVAVPARVLRLLVVTGLDRRLVASPAPSRQPTQREGVDDDRQERHETGNPPGQNIAGRQPRSGAYQVTQ
jgi:anti-sigma B factor antagonist